MTGLSDVLALIDAAPDGPRIGAFVDLDGTLVAGYTAGAFYRDRLRRRAIGAGELARSVAVFADSLLGGDPGRLGPIAVAGLRGEREEELDRLGQRIYARELAATVRPEVRRLVRAHQDRGHTIVLATSATRFQAEPLANDLGIEHLLCSELESDGGRLTGEFRDGGMLWGSRKAAAVRRVVRERDLDAAESFAYANGDEDVALLAGVGRPHAVNPGHLLERVARAEGWPVLSFQDPGGSRLRNVIGTVAAVGGMNAVLAAGLGAGILTRDRRAAANLASGPAFDLALSLSGVRTRVSGRENLWTQRPAVFIFNHQSNLDPIVVGALVRRDFTATGKLEARNDPAAMLAGRLMDAVYLDRANPQDAKREINRLVARLEGGESVLIAPEGTRRAVPPLGEFKHGAFHLARRAGVPLVPVVLRNTAQLMPPSATAIRSGVVDVHVLEPVSTRRWKAGDVGRHAASLRARVQDTLDHWPAE
jgi:putative phosphoserine phosphatase / 1-acylglycerol-3-phosphate O-acyltransferase